MMKYLLVTLLSATVMAQSTPKIPTCGKSCVDELFETAGCKDNTDWVCLCSKGEVLGSGVMKCSQECTDKTEGNTVNQIIQNICANGGKVEGNDSGSDSATKASGTATGTSPSGTASSTESAPASSTSNAAGNTFVSNGMGLFAAAGIVAAVAL